MQPSEVQDLSNRPNAEPNKHTPVQAMFLIRLEELIERRTQYLLQPNPEESRLKLLNKAIYSNYMDCASLDLAAEAKELLRAPMQPSAS